MLLCVHSTFGPLLIETWFVSFGIVSSTTMNRGVKHFLQEPAFSTRGWDNWPHGLYAVFWLHVKCYSFIVNSESWHSTVVSTLLVPLHVRMLPRSLCHMTHLNIPRKIG